MSERGKRQWVLRADDFETEDDFRAAVARELADLENIGHRLGGGFIASPLRQATEDASGLTEYVTRGWIFEHTFMPVVKPKVEPEPELTEDEITAHFPQEEPVEA